MRVECTFVLEKTTPGALRYRQVSQDGRDLTAIKGKPDDMLVGTLYLRKAQLEGEPKQIKIIVGDDLG